jgi:ABC-type lipoprotein export system ATPase subunit
MGISVLILGDSGSGKTTSLRNFQPGEVAIINVAKKPLKAGIEIPHAQLVSSEKLTIK